MKKLFVGLLCAAPAISFAQPQAKIGGNVDLYFVPSANLDIGLSGLGSADDDGDGFGIKARLPFADNLSFSGEYQAVSYDDSDLDFDQMRLGIDLGTSKAVRVEYIDAELDNSGADGFAIHGILSTEVSPGLNLSGQIGYVMLEDDDGEDMKGLEFSIGIDYSTSDQIAFFADYRNTSLEDDSNNDIEFADIRLGIRFKF